MIDIFNDFEVELSGIKYLIKPTEMNTHMGEWRYSIVYRGNEHMFDTVFSGDLIDVLIFAGVKDKKTESSLIIYYEIKKSLFELVYDISMSKLEDMIIKCSTEFELLALSQQEPLVAIWLDNFDRKD